MCDITGDVLECWKHFVLACRSLCTKHITLKSAKLGDALLLQFCRRTEHIFGSEFITPNMHLHCHLLECIDYGPLHSFWCFEFERYNVILSSMPNNNRCIAGQLMRKFLNENQMMNSVSNHPRLLTKTKHTGSIADTMLASAVQGRGDNPQEWTLDSLGSSIVLPKFSSHCIGQ